MKYKYSINGHKRTPGSNEQYEVYKYSISGHKRTPGSNEQYEIQIFNNGRKRTPGSNEQYVKLNFKTQIFNKWPQENAWLKRAIMKTNIQ